MPTFQRGKLRHSVVKSVVLVCSPIIENLKGPLLALRCTWTLASLVYHLYSLPSLWLPMLALEWLRTVVQGRHYPVPVPGQQSPKDNQEGLRESAGVERALPSLGRNMERGGSATQHCTSAEPPPPIQLQILPKRCTWESLPYPGRGRGARGGGEGPSVLGATISRAWSRRPARWSVKLPGLRWWERVQTQTP